MVELSTENASVLVVDDNPLIVNVLKSLLGANGYHVFTANNGEEAIGVLAQKLVDVIVCDVMMPKMDGYELHHQVRQKAEFSHIPFLFLTALNDSGEIIKGKETGADDYLVKPFDPQDLLAVVRGKIQRSRSLKTFSEEKFDNYRRKVVHTLSHEFRTPLVAINTGTELLIEQHNNLDVQKVQNLLEAIRRGGMRLERLVNDFMVLQQIEAGVAQKLYDNRAAERNLIELVEQFIESKGPTIREEGFGISFSKLVEQAKVFIYEPHVHDIIWRLVSNAIKFSPDHNLIELCLYRQEHDYIIEVRDRGIGMDTLKIKEAIDAFGQIDREKLEQQGGGLGLAIANRYAKINKCRLDFESRKDGGTVVSLLLPVFA